MQFAHTFLRKSWGTVALGFLVAPLPITDQAIDDPVLTVWRSNTDEANASCPNDAIYAAVSPIDADGVGFGHLDAFMGHFAVTPEYPGGAYAYPVTIDESGIIAHPSIFGPDFYGDGLLDTLRGTEYVSADAEEYLSKTVHPEIMGRGTPGFIEAGQALVQSAPYELEVPPGDSLSFVTPGFLLVSLVGALFFGLYRPRPEDDTPVSGVNS